jgi:Flp pilus assembly pilin Flp
MNKIFKKLSGRLCRLIPGSERGAEISEYAILVGIGAALVVLIIIFRNEIGAAFENAINMLRASR